MMEDDNTTYEEDQDTEVETEKEMRMI